MRWCPWLVALAGCELAFPLEGPQLPQVCLDDARYATIGAPRIDGPDHLYRIETTMKTWQRAEAICVSESTHLAAPDSFAELALIRKAATDLAIGNLWLGVARDMMDDPVTGFRLVTGQVVAAELWRNGEPNNTGGVEYGAEFDTSTGGGLVDKETTASDAFMCECDGQPVRSFDFP